MSHLYSENTNRHLRLTVRVKFLDLNQALTPEGSSARHDYSRERLGAVLSSRQDGKSNSVTDHLEVRKPTESLSSEPRCEVCMQSDAKIAADEFEEHTEFCPICSNRVELQLDFMECLEAAVYQRLNEPDSRKLHGALMVSAPAFNFAICGELEID